MKEGSYANGPGCSKPNELARSSSPRHPLHAMILLGINGGLGQADLPPSDCSRCLGGAVLNTPARRPAVPRRSRCGRKPLQPREALRRGRSRSWRQIVTSFLSPSMAIDGPDKMRMAPRSTAFGWSPQNYSSVLNSNVRESVLRHRHTFETIGGDAKDQIAVDHSWATPVTTWPACYRGGSATSAAGRGGARAGLGVQTRAAPRRRPSWPEPGTRSTVSPGRPDGSIRLVTQETRHTAPDW